MRLLLIALSVSIALALFPTSSLADPGSIIADYHTPLELLTTKMGATETQLAFYERAVESEAKRRSAPMPRAGNAIPSYLKTLEKLAQQHLVYETLLKAIDKQGVNDQYKTLEKRLKLPEISDIEREVISNVFVELPLAKPKTVESPARAAPGAAPEVANPGETDRALNPNP